MESIHVEIKRKEGPLVVALKEKLDSLNAQEVYKKMEEILQNSPHDLVLDLTQLDYISSAGLQVLLMCAKNRQSLGKKTAIYGAKGIVEEVLTVTGFYSFIEKLNDIPSGKIDGNYPE